MLLIYYAQKIKRRLRKEQLELAQPSSRGEAAKEVRSLEERPDSYRVTGKVPSGAILPGSPFLLFRRFSFI